MGKQMKSGKKRRSKSNRLTLAEVPRIARSRFYEELPTLLVALFSAFDSEMSDKELKQDIILSMEAVTKIEEFELKRESLSQKYRQYPQDSIATLGRIMRKTSLTVNIDFQRYSYITAKTGVRYRENKDSSGVIEMLKAMAKVTREIERKESLPKLRFFPVRPNDEGPEVNYQYIRFLLTAGLFDYLQRVILGESRRPRRCPSCNNWFIAMRADNQTCSPTCKERHWRAFKGGREKRKIYMRQRRKNQNREKLLSPEA